MKKFIVFIIPFLIICLSIKPFINWQNNSIKATNYTIISKEIPSNFNGYKILQIADIQGKDFGNNNKSLINKIKAQNADMMVIVGDLIDDGVSYSNDIIINLLKSLDLPKQLYAVSGNHDLWDENFKEYKKQWEIISNIKFLENKSIPIEKDGQTIYLHGISDPYKWDYDESKNIVENNLNNLKVSNGFNILLFHRANMLDMFIDQQYDLVLSGHMHGGQIRLPFVGGLKSPHGDWFPKYSAGKYNVNDKNFIVTRGICNSVPIPRIFNRPEIVVITLKCE